MAVFIIPWKLYISNHLNLEKKFRCEKCVKAYLVFKENYFRECVSKILRRPLFWSGVSQPQYCCFRRDNFLLWRGCSVPWSMFRSISGLYLLDVGSSSPAVTIKYVSRHCQIPLGSKSAPSHWNRTYWKISFQSVI